MSIQEFDYNIKAFHHTTPQKNIIPQNFVRFPKECPRWSYILSFESQVDVIQPVNLINLFSPWVMFPEIFQIFRRAILQNPSGMHRRVYTSITECETNVYFDSNILRDTYEN